MGKLGLTGAIVGISLAALLAGGGCAKGDNFQGQGGSGNAAGTGPTGDGGDSTQATATGGEAGATSTSSTGEGGTTSSTTSSTSSTTSTTSTTTTTTSTTTTTTSTTTVIDCLAPQHLCGGQCVGNTPDTGCYQSVSCTPCAAPQFGTSTCTANGLCDFTCAMPYVKMGAACVCANQCCSDADCPAGQACMGGTCQMPMGACDPDMCTAQCIAQCFIQMKLGVGQCQNGTCVCVCL